MTNLQAPCRTLLLVDDEENVIKALRRALRHEGYQIHSANSGLEGLELLSQHEVGVIISDQLMPQMAGTEFLRQAKQRYPKTLRIILSGYSEMETVTTAVNEGFIYKFLFKPWDDEQLRINIRTAFQHYELERENLRLNQQLLSANKELAVFNQQLEQQVREKTQEAMLNIHLLQIAQEMFEHLPIAVFGVDEQGMIAVSNRQANALLGSSKGGGIAGLLAQQVLPPALMQLLEQYRAEEIATESRHRLTLADNKAQVWISPMGSYSPCKGVIVAVSVSREECE